MRQIKELIVGAEGKSRPSRRYLLPNCYQTIRILNQVGPGLSRGGDQPVLLAIASASKKLPPNLSRVMILTPTLRKASRVRLS